MQPTRIAGILMVAFVARAGSAQQPIAILDPEQFVRAYFDAVEAERWLDAAAFVDSRLVERQREEIVRSRRAMASMAAPRMTAATMMQADTTMPLVVAEWYVQRMERAMAEQGPRSFGYQFANIRDTTELLALTPLELTARWLQAHDQREMFRRNRRDNCPGDEPDQLLIRRLVPKRQILGSVSRGDTAWVLHRPEGSALEGLPDHLSAPAVATLIRRDGAWRLHQGDTPGMFQAVSLGCNSRRLIRDTTRSGRRPPS